MKRTRRFKKDNKKLKHLSGSLNYSIKSDDDGEEKLIIKGLANANVVDRGDERIETNAWQLDNFKKNPVILLNHGFDVMGGLPIGKAISVTPTDKGLEIEAEISLSKHGHLPMVRDLIKDGYLSTFSVGFDIIDASWVKEGGKEIFVISKAELFETSVVGIPMNQDSTFTVVSKAALKSGSVLMAEADMLRQKAAHVQANILEMLDHQEDTLDAFCKSMARRTKQSKDEMKQVMLGKVKADELFIKKASNYLDCERKNLFEGDEAFDKINDLLDRVNRGEDPAAVIASLKAETTGEDDDNDDNDDTKVKLTTGSTGEDDDAHTHTYEEGDSETSEANGHTHPIEDGEIGEADGHTHSAAAKENSDDNTDDDNDDDAAAKAEEALKDFQDCVNEKIPALIDEGKEQDEAVAAAIESCSSEKGCDIGAFKNSAFAACFAAVEQFKTEGEWKGVDFSEIKQAIAEGETGDTTPIDMEQNEKADDSDPHLAQTKQTNVLLGTLIGKFDSLIKLMEDKAAVDNTEDNSEDDETKDNNSNDDNADNDDEETKSKKQKALEQLRINRARAKQLELQERMNELSTD